MGTFLRRSQLTRPRDARGETASLEHAAVQKMASSAARPKPRPISKKSGSKKSGNLAQVPLQAKRGGQPMPDGIRTKMEKAFNTDFADVKVHEGSEAPAVGALAYTQQNHIHFAPGQFKPETSAGQALLGHELAHVLQQRQGRVKPTTQVNGVPVNDDPALEQEADRLGLKAARS